MTSGGVAAAGSLAYVVGRGVTYSGSQVATRSTGGGLKAFAANMVPGGPGKDGIPAIDRSRFIVPRPGLLADDDVVCGAGCSPLALAILLAVLAWSAKRLAGLGPPSIRAHL